MASHRLVEFVIDQLADRWDTDIYPGEFEGGQPVLIDAADSQVYEITSAGSATVGDATVGRTWQQRSVSYDLAKNNAVRVGPSPGKANTLLGAEADYSVEDGVSVRIEGAHESEFGHISGSDELTALVNATRQAIHETRKWPRRNTNPYFHTLHIANEENNSEAEMDYYRYDFDVFFDGYEELP